MPQINVRVNGHEVDALFPEQKVIVECDGYETHRDRGSFESDRERDAENLRHGFRTVRLTRERLLTKPGREAKRLREILDRR
jgi:very-short-patch-repair endonuclease